jgi:hypothetical protein
MRWAVLRAAGTVMLAGVWLAAVEEVIWDVDRDGLGSASGADLGGVDRHDHG